MPRHPERSLDLLNIAVAGMRDGVGPLLSVFLIRYASLDPSGLSWVMAAPGIAALCLQIPLGFLYDKITDRRLVLAAGGVAMILASFLLSMLPGFYGLLAAQAITGLAMSMISVGLPALSIQVCGSEGFGRRLARNEVFCKIGNFAALGISGLITQKYGLHWMFAVIYFFAGSVVLASLAMPRAEKHLTPAPERGPSFNGKPWLATLKSPAFLKLISLTALYFFANSSMFFVFEQIFVPAHPNGGAGYISTALGFNQVIVFFASLYLARKSKLGDPLKILGFGFLLMIIRGVSYAADLGLYSLGFSEFLDGILAAIVIIVPSRAIAALDEKNFNVLCGFVGTAASLGASMSTISAGYLIEHVGHAYTFLTFASFGGLGLAAVVVLSGLQALRKPFKPTLVPAYQNPSPLAGEPVRARAG